MTKACLTVSVLILALSCSTRPDEIANAQDQSDTRAQYLQAANSICAEANARIASLPPPSAETQIAYAREVNEITRTTIAHVRALPTPTADGARLADLYRRAMAATQAAERSLDASERGDLATAERAGTKAQRVIFRVNNELFAYGLTECAK